MILKNYKSYLKINDEKTGDSIDGTSRLNAAKYFAAKKNIPLKEWIKIYYIPKE